MWLMSLWDVQHKQRAKEIEFGFCSRECLVTRCLIFAHLVGILRSFFFHKLLEKRRQFCNSVFRLVVGVWANCMRKSRAGMDRGALNKHLAHGLELIRFWTIAHHHWGSDISLYMMQCIIVGNLACWMPQWEWITNAFHSLSVPHASRLAGSFNLMIASPLGGLCVVFRVVAVVAHCNYNSKYVNSIWFDLFCMLSALCIWLNTALSMLTSPCIRSTRSTMASISFGDFRFRFVHAQNVAI